jgi:outer membrane protein assembly factor BamB
MILSWAFAQTAAFDPSAPNWTSWRGPQGNGISAENGWKPPASLKSPKILWKAKVGVGYSSVCVYGGYAFTSGIVSGEQETLTCLDAATGKAVWTFAYPGTSIDYPGSRAMPVLDEGRLYTLSITGTAHCLDAATGKKIWSTDLVAKAGAESPNWGFSSSCLIQGKLAYFNATAGGVALDKASGALVWKGPSGVCGYSTPVAFAMGAKPYLALFAQKELVVVEADTGKRYSGAPWKTDYDVNAMDPLVIGDRIFVSSAYNHGAAMFKIAPKSLETVWTNKTFTAHYSSVVYKNGYIYGASGSPGYGEYVCLKAADGSTAWSSMSSGVGSLTMVGDYLLAVSETGKLSVIKADPGAFSEVASASSVIPRLVWTAPVFAGGKIYLRNDKGDLVCVDATK